MIAAGCGDDDVSGPAPIDITGAWQQVAGPRFDAPGAGTIEDSGVALFLEFGGGAAASRHARDTVSGLVHCAPATYGFTVDGLLMFSAEPEHVPLFRVERSGSDRETLVLTDVGRRSYVFALEPALPDSMVCREPVVVRRFDLPLDLETYTGLAWDGVQLWFTDSEHTNLIAVDPETGVLGAPRPVKAHLAPVVQSAEGGDLWRLAASSYCEAAYLIGPDETVRNSFDSAEVGFSLAIRGLAFDPASGHVLIHRGSCGGQMFLRIDARSEPARLVESAYVPGISVVAMACLGERVLAVCAGQIDFVAELDPITWRAVATWNVVDPAIDLQGIAVADGRVFLLGQERGVRAATILEVQP
jgi:hypothetical protein